MDSGEEYWVSFYQPKRCFSYIKRKGLVSLKKVITLVLILLLAAVAAAGCGDINDTSTGQPMEGETMLAVNDIVGGGDAENPPSPSATTEMPAVGGDIVVFYVAKHLSSMGYAPVEDRDCQYGMAAERGNHRIIVAATTSEIHLVAEKVRIDGEWTHVTGSTVGKGLEEPTTTVVLPNGREAKATNRVVEAIKAKAAQ